MLRLRLLMKNVDRNADLKCWSKCCLTCWFKCRLMIWRGCQKAASNAETIERIDEFSNFCQKTASDIETIKCIDEFSNFCQKTAFDIETIRCIDEFSNLSENCIWLWNNQMHWRIFCVFVRKLHFDDRMHWRIFDLSKGCILMMKCIDGFSIYLAVSATNVVAKFWLMWRRQAGRQTKRQKFIADCKICRLRLAKRNLIEMTQAGRQINMLTNRRDVDFVDNAAKQKKKSSIWSML